MDMGRGDRSELTMPVTVVFVHGWSVTDTGTYGGLPVRLKNEAAARGTALNIRDIFLGKYVSFHDEVRLSDLARAFQFAVTEQLADLVNNSERFICITHSTGGPVIRDWLHRFYSSSEPGKICPVSHLIMLAPANFGSALAQIGKGQLGRLKSWIQGIEPGQKILDWLELGSRESWNLNAGWIRNGKAELAAYGVFPFVLIGQSIDRSVYDHLNSYTGETGSDGVVRCASANLNATYIRLVQESPAEHNNSLASGSFHNLSRKALHRSPETAFLIVKGKSHSGAEMGIMRSVKKSVRDARSRELIEAVFDCIQVRTPAQYAKLTRRFQAQTQKNQAEEKIEIETRFLRDKTIFIRDRFSMLIFRVTDTQGFPVADYDLLITAGQESDPNHLPRGFFADRQKNRIHPEMLTYYVNYDRMIGSEAVLDGKGKIIREAVDGAQTLGFRIIPRPKDGFVHYHPCEIKATVEMLKNAIQPNSTTLIDIELQRIVHANAFRLEKLSRNPGPHSFKSIRPGDVIV